MLAPKLGARMAWGCTSPSPKRESESRGTAPKPPGRPGHLGPRVGADGADPAAAPPGARVQRAGGAAAARAGTDLPRLAPGSARDPRPPGTGRKGREG